MLAANAVLLVARLRAARAVVGGGGCRSSSTWRPAASTRRTATVGALSRHASHAGSASALMGTMQFVLGAVSGLLVGIASDGTVRPMAALMLTGALSATIADLRRPDLR